MRKIFLKTFGWPMPACRLASRRSRGQAGLRYRVYEKDSRGVDKA
ncbi:MAG: SAC family polyphosphoinositide phosphatase [Candidatus Omnitrophica bacterium]|nr:SAC family polyphosphoinositide phosphatase [Candidatus Omnitrophota bacterium]